MEVEERLAEVAGGGGGVAGGGGRSRGGGRRRARERVRRRRPSGARAAAGAGAGERRRRGGRRRGIRWGWANFKVDKVGWAVFMGLSMHLYSCSLLFVFFFCKVIRVYTCICETPRKTPRSA